MARKVITDEDMFWSLLEAGLAVYCLDYQGSASKCDAEGCLEGRDLPDKEWLNDFRTRWLPQGDYFVETE